MPGLLVLLSLGMLSHQGLLGVDIMEARNLITAREMIETGHWFLPTLHGEPRLAKPPLPTWLTAWAMLLGNAGLDTDLAVNRIPSTLAGLLLAASLFGLTRLWTKNTEAAAWTTAFLATSYMFVLMARRNSWDIYCHAFMLAAIWGMSVIAASRHPRKRLAVATGLLLGLSGLSKGPVGYYALLMLVPEKKDRYLLPVLIPLCQLMGVYLTGLLRDPEQGGRLGRALILLNTMLFGALSLAAPVMLWWWRERFPALSDPSLPGVGMVATLCAVLMYRLHSFRDLRVLFVLKFSLLGLLVLGVPALLQPPGGDMSVPLREIRAFTAGATIVCDSSLKFQDAWVIGSKPHLVETSRESNLPDTIVFVSRDSASVLPDALRGYEPGQGLDVTDFSGHTLHVLALRKTQAAGPAPEIFHTK